MTINQFFQKKKHNYEQYSQWLQEEAVKKKMPALGLEEQSLL